MRKLATCVLDMVTEKVLFTAEERGAAGEEQLAPHQLTPIAHLMHILNVDHKTAKALFWGCCFGKGVEALLLVAAHLLDQNLFVEVGGAGAAAGVVPGARKDDGPQKAEAAALRARQTHAVKQHFEDSSVSEPVMVRNLLVEWIRGFEVFKWICFEFGGGKKSPREVTEWLARYCELGGSEDHWWRTSRYYCRSSIFARCRA